MTNTVPVLIEELEGVALNAAVAVVTGTPSCIASGKVFERKFGPEYSPSTDWSQGGPLIDRYDLNLGANSDGTRWASPADEYPGQVGLTTLEAAMRAIVAAHTEGPTVQVPASLVGGE